MEVSAQLRAESQRSPRHKGTISPYSLVAAGLEPQGAEVSLGDPCSRE